LRGLVPNDRRGLTGGREAIEDVRADNAAHEWHAERHDGEGSRRELDPVLQQHDVMLTVTEEPEVELSNEPVEPGIAADSGSVTARETACHRQWITI
jgi:hypothetical protein